MRHKILEFVLFALLSAISINCTALTDQEDANGSYLSTYECHIDFYKVGNIDLSKNGDFFWITSKNIYGPPRPAFSVNSTFGELYKCRNRRQGENPVEAFNFKLPIHSQQAVASGPLEHTLRDTIWLDQYRYYQSRSSDNKSTIKLTTLKSDGIEEEQDCILVNTKANNAQISWFGISNNGKWLAYLLSNDSHTKNKWNEFGVVADSIDDLNDFELVTTPDTLHIISLSESCDEVGNNPAKPKYSIYLDNANHTQKPSRFSLSATNAKLVIAYQSGLPNLVEIDYDIILHVLNINEYALQSAGNPIVISKRQNQLDGMDTKPKVSPNTKFISYIQRANPSDEAARESIQVVEIADNGFAIKQEFNLGFFDNPIISYEWSCNGSCLLISIESQGETKIIQVGEPGKEITKLNWDKAVEVLNFHRADNQYTSSNQYDGVSRQYAEQFTASKNGLELTAAVSDLITPTEIIHFSREQSSLISPFRITNRTCADTDLENSHYNRCYPALNGTYKESFNTDFNVTSFTIDTPQMQPVSGYVVQKDSKPANNAKRPTILFVHSGPTGSWPNKFDPRVIELVVAGYAVILPNPAGSFGYGYDHVYRSKNAWGTTIRDELQLVMDTLLTAPEYRYLNLDHERLAAIGSSFGGYMMSLLAVAPLTYQHGKNISFKALVSINGIYNLEKWAESTDELWYPNDQLGVGDILKDVIQHSDPSKRSDNLKKYSPPFLIVTSLDDKRVRPHQSTSLFKELKKRCIPARLIAFPDEDHSPNARAAQFIQVAMLSWFDQYVLNIEKDEIEPVSPTRDIEAIAKKYINKQVSDSCE